MRVAIVTNTDPSEIDGVALTVAGFVRGPRQGGHEVQVICPHHPLAGAAADLLEPGMRFPRYAEFRFGLPARHRLETLWKSGKTDAIYVATESPCGNSVLNAARRLSIPAYSGFHTRFDEFARHYGLGLIVALVFSSLRRVRRRGAATLVPTSELADFMHDRGFAQSVCANFATLLAVLNTRSAV